jgi:hypothetical protein
MQVYSSAKLGSRRAELREILLIDDDDTELTINNKMMTFYFGCGRLPLIQTEPYIPASKRPKGIPHAHILLRPDDRRKYTDGTYDDNGRCRVPWFDPAKFELLSDANYRNGNIQLRYHLNEDIDYIIINCFSRSEGVEFLKKCVECIYPSKRSPGNTEDNITETKRRKTASKHSREGVRMRVYAIDWRNGRNQMPFGRFHI